MSLVELTAALAVLRNDARESKKDYAPADKILACRTATSMVCSSKLQGNADFQKLLALVLGGLIKTESDSAFQVWSVADECLINLINELIFRYPDRILVELFKGLKSYRGRPQRASLEKFSQLCSRISPLNSRKFTLSLLEPLEEIARRGDDDIKETLGNAMEGICKTLVFFMREQEVQALLRCFVVNIGSSAAVVRRSAAQCIVSLCRHYPKMEFDFVTDLLLGQYAELTSVEGLDALLVSFSLQGILQCLIQLIKLSVDMGKRHGARRDPMVAYIPALSPVIHHCLQLDDHNLATAALELLDVTMEYGEWEHLWGDEDATKAALFSFLRPISSIVFNDLMGTPKCRMSVKSIAISVLGRIVLYFAPSFLEFVSVELGDISLADIVAALQAYTVSNDPLCKGNALVFVAHLVARHVMLDDEHRRRAAYEHLVDETTTTGATPPFLDITSEMCLLSSKYINVQQLLDVITQGVKDSSSVTSNEACRAIKVVMPYLYTSPHSIHVLSIVSALTSFEHPYWLIRSSVMELLSCFDYTAIAYVEKEFLHNRGARTVPVYRDRQPLQDRALAYIVKQLEHENWRVADAACTALAGIVQVLHAGAPLRGQLPQDNLGNILREFESSAQSELREDDRIRRNFTVVVPLLLNGLNIPLKESVTKAYYHALYVLLQSCWKRDKGTGSWLYELVYPYINEIIPLTLTRISGTAMALDLDSHIEVIKMIWLIMLPVARDLHPDTPSPRMLVPAPLRLLWKPVLTHIVRILSIGISLSMKQDPITLQQTQSGQPLGFFASMPIYVELHNALLKQMTAGSTNASLEPTKLDVLTKACLKTLASAVRCAGQAILQYAGEIVSYLSIHTDKYPGCVVECIHELFLSCCTDDPDVQVAVTSSVLFPRAASTPAVANLMLAEKMRLAAPPIGGHTGRRCSLQPKFGHSELEMDELSYLLSVTDGGGHLPVGYKPSKGYLSVKHSNQASTAAEPAPSTPVRERSGLPVARSTPMVTQVNSPSRIEDMKIRSGKKMIRRKLEQLATLVVAKYRATHKLSFQQSTLLMVSQLIRHGVPLKNVDKNSEFLGQVTNQVLGKKSYLPDPPAILPFIFDFISLVALQSPDLLPLDSIKKLTSCVFHSPYWSGSGTLLPSLHALVYTLFSPTVSSPTQAQELNELRDALFPEIVAKLPLPQAVSLLIPFLKFLKNRDQVAHSAFSRQVLDKMLPALASGEAVALNVTQVEQLIEMFRQLDRSQLDIFTVCETLTLLLRVRHEPSEDGPVLASIAPAGCVVVDRCPWLPSVLVLLHCLAEIVRGNSELMAQASQLCGRGDGALATLLLELAEKGLAHYTATATMSGAPSYWSLLARLYQYSAFLVCQPLDEVDTLLDISGKTGATLTPEAVATLQVVAQQSIATGNPALIISLLKWLSAMQAHECAVWRKIVLEPTDVYWASLASWKAHIISATAFLCFCSTVSRAEEEELKDMLPLCAASPSFSARILGWVHNATVHRTVALLVDYPAAARTMCEAIQEWLDTSIASSSSLESAMACLSDLDKHILPRTLRGSNIFVFCSLLPFGAVPAALLRLVATAMRTSRPYSHRKLCRTFLKAAVADVQATIEPEGASGPSLPLNWTNDTLETLSSALGGLQESNVLKGGSTLDHAITRVLPALASLMLTGEATEQEHSQEAAQVLTAEAALEEIYAMYDSGRFVHISALEQLDSEQAARLLALPSVTLMAVSDMLLEIADPAAPLGREGMAKLVALWKEKLGAEMGLLERFAVSNSLAIVAGRYPELLSASMEGVMALDECLQYCLETTRQYIDESGFAVRTDATQTLASTFQLATLALGTYADFSSPTPLSPSPTAVSFVKALFDAFQMCLSFTDVTLHRVVPLHNTAAEGQEEEQSVPDMLTSMLVKLVTPDSEDCSGLTLSDTRASSSFQYCFGKATFQAAIELLTTFTKATTDIYPEVFVEGDEIFLETPMRVLGMTLSDADILVNTTQLLPLVGVSHDGQLQRLFTMLRTIVQSPAGTETLKCLAVRCLAVLNNVLYNLYIHQHTNSAASSPWKSAQLQANPPRERSGGQPKSAASFFDSAEGQTLFHLQAHVETALSAMNSSAVSSASKTGGSHLAYNQSAFYRVNTDLCFVDKGAKAFMQYISSPDRCEGAELWKTRKVAAWISKETLSATMTSTLDMWLDAYATFDMLVFLREDIVLAMASVTHLMTVSQLDQVTVVAGRVGDQAEADDVPAHGALLTQAKAMAILRPTDTLILQGLCNKVRASLESTDAAAHLSALKAASYLLLASAIPLTTASLFPFLYDYIVRALDKPSDPIFLLEVTQYQVLQLAFTLMHQPAKTSELQRFTGVTLHLLLGLGLSSDISPLVRSALFRGFNGLLVTFTLSHSHRELMRSFALQTLPTSNFLWATGLVLTFMYTGDKEEEDAPSNSEIVYMDKVERVKIMLAIMRNGLSYEAEMVTRVLPRVLVDFFSTDQIMSLVLGEFMRTTPRHRPELMMQVLHASVALLSKESHDSHVAGMVHWILICLANILQLRPFTYSIWTVTCVFLSVISGSKAAPLYKEIGGQVQDVPDVLFLWVAQEFYSSPALSDDDRELFVEAFSAERSSHPLLSRMLGAVQAVCPLQPTS